MSPGRIPVKYVVLGPMPARRTSPAATIKGPIVIGARADALRQPSGPRREHEHQHSDRQRRGARLQGGVTEHGLELDDDEEQRHAQCRVHDEGRDVGSR